MERGDRMDSRTAWNVFKETGSVHAYLLYRHCLEEEKKSVPPEQRPEAEPPRFIG